MVQLCYMPFGFECIQELYQPQESSFAASHILSGADAFL